MTDTYRRTLQGLPPPSIRAVLDQLCRGLTQQQIARALGRSPDTVKGQLSTAYRLLDCANSVQAALVWSQMRTDDGARARDNTLLAAGHFE